MSKHVRYFFWALITTVGINSLISSNGIAQNSRQLDSLRSCLSGMKADSNMVHLYFKIGELYEKSELEKAKEYYNKARILSDKIGYTKGYYTFAINYTYVLDIEGLHDSSIIINQKALKLAEAEKNRKQVAVALGGLGKSYTYKSQYETALNYYQKALPYIEEAKDTVLQTKFNDILQCLYYYLKQYDRAIVYGEKAVAVLKNKPNSHEYGNALMNLSVNYLHRKPPWPEKALEGQMEVLRIAKFNGNLKMQASALNNIADCYLTLQKPEEARKYHEKGLALGKRMNSVRTVYISSMGLGFYEMQKNNFDRAEKYFREALVITKKHKMLTQEKDCVGAFVDLSLARNDYTAYKRYERSLDSLSNIVLNETIQKAILELETKYETEKKDSRIKTLEQERKLVLGLSGSGILIFILLVLLLIFRNRIVKHQKIIAEQRIVQLKQEKQLIANQSILEGETAERSRLARDLHDGIGGMLSVVRLNLKGIKTGAFIENEDVNRYGKALSMLDDSIKELRRVAHHMMPESLLMYGLKASLTDFCNDIPSVQFHYFGNNNRIDQQLEILIYRSAHELVNNALRHAEAKLINLQLVQEDDRISLTVQDDGKGFDPDTVEKGMGLESVNTRVASFNGKMSIYSSPGNGTEINIEFQLNQKS